MNKATTKLAETDFVEAPLSLAGIDPVELERLILHLLDEMGFSDLSWRKGGDGSSATDGGGDIEATHWRFDPIGPTEERYWFEIKCRKNQLKRGVVQKTVINACQPNVAHVVIVTNSTVSNPCLDWTKEFQKSPNSPRVTVWQGHDLELMLRKNPRTLAEFFSDHLNAAGRLKVVESKFSNLGHLPSGPELQELWDARDRLVHDEKHLLLLAAILGEVSTGDPARHPWGMYLDSQTRFTLTVFGVYNAFTFADKMESNTGTQEPLARGLSYLLQCILVGESVERAYFALVEPEKFVPKAVPFPSEHTPARLEPTINAMLDDLALRCSVNCPEVEYPAPYEATPESYFHASGRQPRASCAGFYT